MVIKMKICKRCIMDSEIVGIRFDENGICNFCKIQDFFEKKSKELNLQEIVNKIKLKGKNKKYDCLIGISGGIDSTYLLYFVTKKLRLRPLVIHIDNEWNSEIATENIEKIVSKLNVDLKTINVDWNEFRDLQIAFLKASVPGVEVPTDSALISIPYKIALENDIKTIIIGNNYRTEGRTPFGWGYSDGRYVKSIYKKFTGKKLKSYPNLTWTNKVYYHYFKKIHFVRLLDYIVYDKKEATEIVKKEVGWKPYGHKHYESIYTRFVQSYLLPEKFNIDKRKSHFSALIRSGQMKREDALYELQNNPPYPEEKKKEDLEYVLKKLELTKEEWNEIFNRKPKTFLDYSSYYPFIKRTPIWIISKLVSSNSTEFLHMIFDEMKYCEQDFKNKAFL